MSKIAGFHPLNAHCKEALKAFLEAPLSGDLLEVPGIGSAVAKKLAKASVKSTHQLIGQFLKLKPYNQVDPTDCTEHLQLFWDWLKGLEINTRTKITLAIAEKVNCWCPGIYNRKQYTEEDEDEDEDEEDDYISFKTEIAPSHLEEGSKYSYGSDVDKYSTFDDPYSEYKEGDLSDSEVLRMIDNINAKLDRVKLM